MENLLFKIQSLPESKRKIILWVVIAILGLTLMSIYIKNAQKKLKSIEMKELKEELPLPPLEEELKNLPKIEMPEINQEKLQELKQTTEEAPI